MADETGTEGAGPAGQRAPEGGESKPKKQSSPGSLAWLWMVLALVTVGGFLAWLGMTAEPTSVAVVQEEDPIISDPPDVTVVNKDTLAAYKERYVAQRVRVHNVAATGALGDQIFWGELGDATTQLPMLVRLDSATAADFTPQVGTFYSVRGRAFPMTDSLANAWGEQGEFFGEGEQIQAAFTDYYMQVDDIVPTPSVLRTSSEPSMPAADTAGMEGEGGDGATDGESSSAGSDQGADASG